MVMWHCHCHCHVRVGVLGDKALGWGYPACASNKTKGGLCVCNVDGPLIVLFRSCVYIIICAYTSIAIAHYTSCTFPSPLATRDSHAPCSTRARRGWCMQYATRSSSAPFPDDTGLHQNGKRLHRLQGRIFIVP
jgi:hypothetical protein